MNATSTPTLLSDLIHIPERVHAGDFVLKLTTGIEGDAADQTLDQYVITDQLVSAFDQALGLIADAVSGADSKAAYLHGSFGSGKSHFMAVLHLILNGHSGARSRPELAPVIAKYDPVLHGKKFLLPSYHMIGEGTLESKIFGGYVRHVQRRHPEALPPALYRSGTVFESVEHSRQNMGVDKFLEVLNSAGGGGADDGWGDLSQEWTIESYTAARDAAPESDEHRGLLSVAIVAFKLEKLAGQSGSEFVDMDDGLSIMSAHAQQLGYDAIILFLDELILWLATLMGDPHRVKQEAAKVAKLVEAGDQPRPVPLISLVARQRDLRELVGEDLPGAEKHNFADILNWFEGRFSTITLEDRNLPQIAERRLLRPLDEEAAAKKLRAFKDAAAGADMNVLLGDKGSMDLFQQVYPFSPALVDTLIAVSSALQRERTALKVMAIMLANRRSDLQAGQFIPLGDLFDVIADGDDPLSPEMRSALQDAKQLYASRLEPLLLSEHGLSSRDGGDAAKQRAFRADDRLVKSLLLAALVPGAESLKNLTVDRLVALNHGEVRSQIPGQEFEVALSKVKKWAGQVGEIRIGEENPANPTLQVQLLGVDTDAILQSVRSNDTPGARKRLVQELLFEQMGIANDAQGQLERLHQFTWRGTTREIEVLVGNIRDAETMPDARFKPSRADALLVLDMPFDEGDFSARDDLARLEPLEQTMQASTVCWVPNHFSPALRRDLGTLLCCEYVLSPAHFDSHTQHLPQVQREQAKGLLQNRRSSLRERVKTAITQAYGAATPTEDMVVADLEPSEQLRPLDPALQLAPVKGPALSSALGEVREQIFGALYPEHPRFEASYSVGDVQKVLDELLRGIAIGEPSFEVELKPLRSLLSKIAQPLQLGTMHATRFEIGSYWREYLDRCVARAEADGAEHVTVGMLRQWMEEPVARGLEQPIQNLVLRVYAEQTRRSFEHHGGPFTVEIKTKVPSEVQLAQVDLPSDTEFGTAVARATALFGIPSTTSVSPSTVESLAAKVKTRASELRVPSATLVSALGTPLGIAGLTSDDSTRWATASSTSDLVGKLADASKDRDVIHLLIDWTPPSSAEAAGKSLSSADAVGRLLKATEWDFVQLALTGAASDAERQDLRDELRSVLEHDELAVSALEGIPRVQSKTKVIIGKQQQPQPQPPKVPARPKTVHVDGGEHSALKADEALQVLDQLKDKVQSGDRSRYLSLSWALDEDESDA